MDALGRSSQVVLIHVLGKPPSGAAARGTRRRLQSRGRTRRGRLLTRPRRFDSNKLQISDFLKKLSDRFQQLLISKTNTLTYSSISQRKVRPFIKLTRSEKISLGDVVLEWLRATSPPSRRSPGCLTRLVHVKHGRSRIGLFGCSAN